MLKKESIFLYKQMIFFILCGKSWPGTFRPFFRTIDITFILSILVYNTYLLFRMIKNDQSIPTQILIVCSK